MLAGGGIYYLLEEYLSRQVRNGIDSFGIRADIVLPYPFEDTVHLQGSMIMLIFCIIGWRLLVKKAVLRPVAERKVIVDEKVMAEGKVMVEGKKIVMQIPDPVEVRVKPQVTRKACTPVAMPVTATRNNGIYPCIVDGEIKPAVFRAKDSRSMSQLAPSTSTTS